MEGAGLKAWEFRGAERSERNKNESFARTQLLSSLFSPEKKWIEKAIDKANRFKAAAALSASCRRREGRPTRTEARTSHGPGSCREGASERRLPRRGASGSGGGEAPAREQHTPSVCCSTNLDESLLLLANGRLGPPISALCGAGALCPVPRPPAAGKERCRGPRVAIVGRSRSCGRGLCCDAGVASGDSASSSLPPNASPAAAPPEALLAPLAASAPPRVAGFCRATGRALPR